MNRRVGHIILVAIACMATLSSYGQRKITPVNTAATATQPYNEMEGDSTRIRAKMLERMAHYHDEEGNVIYIDTVTGQEWRDTIAMMEKKKKPMMYPLLESATVGVDIWNPLMRIFGQHYGLIDFMAQLSIHNRYKPTFETGLGLASNTPPDMNFTYKTPLSWYFRVGMDYNFLYNSSTDYQFFLGLRVGLSPFTYTVSDISINSNYWGETAHPEIPSQHATVAWWEFAVGLRVKLWGPISAGWTFRYHNIMKDAKSKYGEPWYIPGYGARGQSITGSLTISYTLPLSKKKPRLHSGTDASDPGVMYFPESDPQPTIEQIGEGVNAQNPI